MREFAFRGAAILTILMGGSYLATPARAAEDAGACPLRAAIAAQESADGNCRALGYSRAYLTELNCDENGNMSFSYACA